MKDGLLPRRIARALGSALWAHTAGGWRTVCSSKVEEVGRAKMAPLLNSDESLAGTYYDARADDARLTLDVAATACK